MRGRSRLLILLGLLIIIVLVVVLVLPTILRPTGTPTPGPGVAAAQQTQTKVAVDATATAAVLPTEEPPVNIVVAVQNLNRGIRIPRDGLAVQPWPVAVVQNMPNAILAPSPDQYPDVEQYNRAIDELLEDVVVGKIARTDILRFQPVLTTMLVEDLEELGRVGSDTAAVLPQGSVAIALPMDRLTSVAYAPQPGDRVDVIVSLLFVDVDEEFQSLRPNQFALLTISPEGEITVGDLIPGRLENTIVAPAIIVPGEDQRPRMATQRTIQDALVVHVGEVPPDGRLFRPEPETPTPAPTVEGAEEGAPAGTPVPTEPPKRPDIIVLGVTPQDAVVLSYFIETRVPMIFALRAAGDASRVPTTSVTLDYVMGQYSISVPGKTDFAVQPALRSIRQLMTVPEISLAPQLTIRGQ